MIEQLMEKSLVYKCVSHHVNYIDDRLKLYAWVSLKSFSTYRSLIHVIPVSYFLCKEKIVSLLLNLFSFYFQRNFPRSDTINL